jgi:putative endopeptidase
MSIQSFYPVIITFSLLSCKSGEKTIAIESVTPIEKPIIKELGTIDLGYLDNTIRPEEDFFQFSNGLWIKNNPIPASESRWGSFNELEQSNKKKLMIILDSLKHNDNDSKGSEAGILGRYYASYIDMERRNELDLSPIQADLDKIKNMRSKADLVGVIAEQHRFGLGSLFNFGVGQDLKKVDRHISFLSQGGIGLPNRDYYFAENKKDILSKYVDHVANMLKLLGYSDEFAQSASVNIVRFETELAGAMMSPSELREPEKTYNKKALQETSVLFGKFDFESYLSELKSNSFDSLIVSQPEFIRKVSELFDKEGMAIWRDYLTWMTIHHYAGALSERFVNETFNFYGKVLSGKNELRPIKERAIDEITGKGFGELLGKVFVKKYFTEHAKKRVNDMVDNLLYVFGERIKSLDWMSDTTKVEALHKLSSIGRKLGYPSKWEDYSGLEFSKDAYLENLKIESRFSVKKELDELKKPVDKDKWGMPAHMVNAYYHPLLNEIAFPAGIMQAPFFDESAEDAVNYGRIGMVIGHEFTHGFDDKGSKFAADGSFRNWWSAADRNKFEEKTGTLGSTFASFCPIEGHCVNPNLTMGENIADLGGLTMAYYAYQLTDEYKSGKIRDGYTPSQRFFIAYGQLWKIKYTEAELKNRIANDPHSPGMYRVNGPLKNCPEFFEAFGIKEGAKMRNPREKIPKIW